MKKELLKVICRRILVAIVGLFAWAYFFYFVASGEVQGLVLRILGIILWIPPEILYYWMCPCVGAILLGGIVLITWASHTAGIKSEIRQRHQQEGLHIHKPAEEAAKNRNDEQKH